MPKDSRDIGSAREMVADGLAAILPHARACRMPLAIEPLHPMYAADRACINTLEQALDVCDLLGDGVGVAIDVYHVWWDPKLHAQIMRAGAGGRILAHHICDWLVPTRDLLLDRGMMGDGVIDLRSIRSMIESAGYDGPQEVEIFSSAKLVEASRRGSARYLCRTSSQHVHSLENRFTERSYVIRIEKPNYW